jgi:hypothetical protein
MLAGAGGGRFLEQLPLTAVPGNPGLPGAPYGVMWVVWTCSFLGCGGWQGWRGMPGQRPISFQLRCLMSRDGCSTIIGRWLLRRFWASAGLRVHN